MSVYHCFVLLHLSWEAKRLKLQANKEEWVSKTDSFVGVSRSFPCMFSASFYADCRLSMHLMFAS